MLAFGRSAVSPFQDRFVFFRNRSHCGLKWAGEGSGAEAPVLPSCATHPPLPVSGFFSWELCGYPLAERTHERASPRTARRVSNRRARAFEFRSSQEGTCSFSSFSCFVKLEMRLISSGEEQEARAVFSREISNLESAALFAFSSSAALQVRQQKAERKIYAPIC